MPTPSWALREAMKIEIKVRQKSMFSKTRAWGRGEWDRVETRECTTEANKCHAEASTGLWKEAQAWELREALVVAYVKG